MFDSFKRPKRIEAVIGTVYPLMHLYCRDEDGKVNDDILEDEYVMAYFYGMISFNMKLLGKINATESGLILLGAFEALFNENGHSLLEECNKCIEQKDEDFMNTAFLAMSELKKLHDNVIAGNSELKLELSIKDYLIDVYN